MKRIGIIANCSKPAAESALKELGRAAERLGLELFTTAEAHPFIPQAEPVEAGEIAGRIDVLMALGGDGTVIGASKLLHAQSVPMIGVNLGSLGFMTSVAQERVSEALDALARDQFTISTRTTLDCQVQRNGNQPLEQHIALNDVVLGWGTSARVVGLNLAVNGEPVTEYICDGLIVSTPTGSTGHSLSAGGPILHPETKAFVVNAICPHTLSARPMVLPDDRTLTISIDHVPEDKNLLLSVDGQQMNPFQIGDVLTLSTHPTGVRFIHLNDYRYFDVLTKKLHWRGQSVHP
jgi:NAD+ kinase